MDSIYTTNSTVPIGGGTTGNSKTVAVVSATMQKEAEGSSRASGGPKNPQTAVPVLTGAFGVGMCEEQLNYKGFYILTVDGVWEQREGSERATAVWAPGTLKPTRRSSLPVQTPHGGGKTIQTEHPGK